MIDRIEVGAYPEGVSRTTPRFRNESPEDQALRRTAVLPEAIVNRVSIVWKGES